MSFQNFLTSFGCLINKIVFSSEMMQFSNLIDQHGLELLYECGVKSYIESSHHIFCEGGEGKVSEIISMCKRSGTEVTFDLILKETDEETALKYYFRNGLDAPLWPIINLGRLANRKEHNGKFYRMVANVTWPLIRAVVDSYKGIFTDPLSKGNTNDFPDRTLTALRELNKNFLSFLEERTRDEQNQSKNSPKDSCTDD